MATLLHVTGEGRDPLPPFAGHLVRNLEWHRYSPEAVDTAVDTVVASPATQADAVQLVVDLRDAGRYQAVVLLVDGSPGWRSVQGAFERVTVVDGLPALRDHLDEVYDVVRPDVAAQAAPEDDDARRHVPRGGTRGMLLERLGDQARQVGREDDPAVWASLVGAGGAKGEGGRSKTAWWDFADLVPGVAAPPVADGTPVVADGPAQAAPATEPPRPREEPTAVPADGPPRAGREPEPDGRRRRRDDADPDRLVEALLDVSDRLYGVRETGTAVAGHVRDVVGVDAVAVLVPDGAVWTVVGAVGHRHLEERLLLGADHWLVREVTHGRHGVLVEDTDVARSRLAGAPLAAWPHLLACPVPVVEGLVVMARSDNGPAFTARDLAHASQALDEAGQLFASALAVRELARRLRRHAELDDPLE